MFEYSLFGGLLPAAAMLFLGICLAACAIGFIRIVFFISIGYGFSIAAMALASMGLGVGAAGPIAWIQALLLAAYGLRLGLYLVARERSASYRASQGADADRAGLGGVGVKLAIWISVCLLYVCQYMPALARFSAEARGAVDSAPALGIAGLAVMGAGLAIEWIADAQKSAAKRANPTRFCASGLYRVSRCPNYFGEMLVWTGNIAAGAVYLVNPLTWTLTAIGYVCIILIMVGSARRLELGQERRYGADPEYRSYCRTVPILLPFVPVFSLKNAKLYLG